MASNIFYNKSIFDILKKELPIKIKNRLINIDDPFWGNFISSKDLGIICIDNIRDLYMVIDEKKWAFSKIKYGF